MSKKTGADRHTGETQPMTLSPSSPACQGSLGPNAGAEEFRKALWDALELDGQQLIDKLGPCLRDNPDRCLPEMIAVFDSDRWEFKRHVADLFKAVLHERAAPVLVPLLHDGNDHRFYWAATILGEIGERTAVPYLVHGLQTTSKVRVTASLKALVGINTDECRRALLEHFLAAPTWAMVSAAMRAIIPLAGDLIPELMQRYSSLTMSRKAWILKFLAASHVPEALPLYAQALTHERRGLGLFAIAGLGEIGTAEAVKLLAEQMVPSNDWFSRKRTAEALGQCKVAEAVPVLLQGMLDASPQVRAAVREALSKVGHLDLPRVLAFINTPNRQARVGLIQALGGIPRPEVIPVLTRQLGDRDLLFFAVEALGELGLADAANVLAPYLADPEWFIRLNAVEALGKLPLPNHARLVEPCLKDDNEMVRQAALRLSRRQNVA